MSRALRWAMAGVALGLVGTIAALLLIPEPPSPRGPEPGRSLFQAHCATCHGHDGRGGSWRARLLLLRPGDLAAPSLAALSDRYLTDLVRHGGSSFGKPGMPAFGFLLSEEELQALATYLRALTPEPPAPRASAGPGA